jgi:hypothetical protein
MRREQQRLGATAVRVRAALRAVDVRATTARQRAEYYQDVLLPIRERIVNDTQLQFNAMNASVFQLLIARRDTLGWELKPQGLCKDDTCIPVPPSAVLVRDGAIDLETLADLLGRPLALDAAENAACLGVAAADRARTLTSLEAPDFTLPSAWPPPWALT